MPKSRLEFWRPKLEGNRARDEKVRAELEELGWTVIEVWECQTKPSQLEQLADKVRDIVRARVAKGKDR
jgi:DNA mismatch endonuclease (patch repair protein)